MWNDMNDKKPSSHELGTIRSSIWNTSGDYQRFEVQVVFFRSVQTLFFKKNANSPAAIIERSIANVITTVRFAWCIVVCHWSSLHDKLSFLFFSFNRTSSNSNALSYANFECQRLCITWIVKNVRRFTNRFIANARFFLPPSAEL